MGQEIEYQVWDEVDKVMRDAAAITFTDNISVYVITGTFEGRPTGKHLRNGFKLREFTGLKDKNGVKVFEGDIVREDVPLLSDPDNHILKIVKWEVLEDAGEYEQHSDGFSGFANPYRGNMEVIGNIYESPELLKEVK